MQSERPESPAPENKSSGGSSSGGESFPQVPQQSKEYYENLLNAIFPKPSSDVKTETSPLNNAKPSDQLSPKTTKPLQTVDLSGKSSPSAAGKFKKQGSEAASSDTKTQKKSYRCC
jgi:hypothetical protein